MGCTFKYYPSTAFLPSVALGALLTPSSCRDSGTSTAANELSRQWAVRLSTAHRLEIRRALYLHHSHTKPISLRNEPFLSSRCLVVSLSRCLVVLQHNIIYASRCLLLPFQHVAHHQKVYWERYGIYHWRYNYVGKCHKAA